MTYYLDYAATWLDGQTIRDAGYPGVIRYVGAGGAWKRTTAAEYQNHVAAGLDVYFVCQGTTADADRGYYGGVDMAHLALSDANAFGYPSNRPIFFTNDRTTLPSPSAWQAFLDGAASVLGPSRVGAYGFSNAMDAAVGHAVYFWQAGRYSDVRPFVHFWQDNNQQVYVGGILCDRNLVLVPIMEEDVPLTREDVVAIREMIRYEVLASNDFRFDGRNVIDMLVQTTSSVLDIQGVVHSPGSIDYDLLADKVAERISTSLADAVNDESDRRARDGDAATGPAS